MLEAAQKAVSWTDDRTRDYLDTDEVLVLALTHLLEIVGEASKNISAQGRDRFPELPWQDMSATRDRLAHGYDSIDLNVLWDTIKLDLPPLVQSLEGIIASLED